MRVISREASKDYEIVGFVCSHDDTHQRIGDQSPLGTGAELSALAERMVAVTDPAQAAVLREEITRGFYGGKPHA